MNDNGTGKSAQRNNTTPLLLIPQAWVCNRTSTRAVIRHLMFTNE